LRYTECDEALHLHDAVRPEEIRLAVTLKDVAKLAGTSTAAASAALNGRGKSSTRVSARTRERIYAAAAQLGYVSNPIAKSLATGRTGVLGLMLPYEDAFVDQNPFCTTLVAGIMREVLAHHYNLMLYTATSGMPVDSAAMMIDSRVDGLLLVIPPDDSSVFLKCETRNIPYVSVLRTPRPGAHTVNCDDFHGGYLATHHLIGLGHRRIAHFVGNPAVNTTHLRLSGYRKALEEAGIAPDPSLEIPSGFLRLPGYEAARSLLSRPPYDIPTAIFACNDLCAAGAIQALTEGGASVPGDVAVVGYDDTLFCTVIQPPLTSVRMPIEEMGARAARMLMSQIEREELAETQPVLPVSLTIRQSCGASSANVNPETRSSRSVLQ
jgi:DNA-binding LacI/PurR family transcriptional regulator